METTQEFTGDTALAILGGLCCLPVGAYYYFTNRETQVVCPNCQGSNDTEATVCKNCNTDLTQYESQSEPRDQMQGE
jgi:hypothetical protein